MLLEVEGITKRFGGLTAVRDASLRVGTGRIVSLIGPNGAGKTTLFATISGFHKPDAGRVRFDGVDITGLRPHAICRLGMARTFQLVRPFTGLTVRENISVGAQLRHGSRRRALELADVVGRRVGLGPVLGQSADTLTVCGRKRLELARALGTEPRLLLLDEVMAGLIPPEVDEIVDIVRAIRDGGTAVLLIEHVMAAVMRLSDEVYVLADGAMLAHGAPQALVQDESVLEAYLGRGAAERLRRQDAGCGVAPSVA